MRDGIIPAISNIAWHSGERLEAYRMMAQLGIGGLEIAPGSFVPACDDPYGASNRRLAELVSETASFGLSIVSMQSLLFGVQGAALFGAAHERKAFLCAMSRAIEFAGRLEIPNLVFGSPRQRIIPDDLAESEAVDSAIHTFRELADKARAVGTVISVEANPSCYGTNFLTTMASAAAFVVAADHPAIRLMLDMGAMHINGDADTVTDAIRLNGGLISHVHISAPDLSPPDESEEQMERLAAQLARHGCASAMSIEMKRQPAGLAALRPAAERLSKALARGHHDQ